MSNKYVFFANLAIENDGPTQTDSRPWRELGRMDGRIHRQIAATWTNRTTAGWWVCVINHGF